MFEAGTECGGSSVLNSKGDQSYRRLSPPPQFESGEEEALLTHAEHWIKELDKAFPGRERKTTVVLSLIHI